MYAVLLILLHKMWDHGVQLGAQVILEERGKKNKNLLLQLEADSAALLQRTAKTLMPRNAFKQKHHYLYNARAARCKCHR